jgi:hypothetical protein
MMGWGQGWSRYLVCGGGRDEVCGMTRDEVCGGTIDEVSETTIDEGCTFGVKSNVGLPSRAAPHLTQILKVSMKYHLFAMA